MQMAHNQAVPSIPDSVFDETITDMCMSPDAALLLGVVTPRTTRAEKDPFTGCSVLTSELYWLLPDPAVSFVESTAQGGLLYVNVTVTNAGPLPTCDNVTLSVYIGDSAQNTPPGSGVLASFVIGDSIRPNGERIIRFAALNPMGSTGFLWAHVSPGQRDSITCRQGRTDNDALSTVPGLVCLGASSPEGLRDVQDATLVTKSHIPVNMGAFESSAVFEGCLPLYAFVKNVENLKWELISTVDICFASGVGSAQVLVPALLSASQVEIKISLVNSPLQENRCNSISTILPIISNLLVRPIGMTILPSDRTDRRTVRVTVFNEGILGVENAELVMYNTRSSQVREEEDTLCAYDVKQRENV
jgi:hypothetical protein